MTLPLVLRRALLVVAFVLLLVLAWTGLNGGIEQLSRSHTTGQAIQTVMQLVYGMCAVLCIVTVYWARRWNLLLLVYWTVALALAGGMGAIFWGDTSLLVGIGSGAAAGLVGAGIAWLVRFGAAGIGEHTS